MPTKTHRAIAPLKSLRVYKFTQTLNPKRAATRKQAYSRRIKRSCVVLLYDM